mmetsp:Transcript_26434/g.30448  ORF Transcript_26434/g.30448 Transcript_26434/m.30448 type:complete len:83 (-) Transcript_26434:75-323(-)
MVFVNGVPVAVAVAAGTPPLNVPPSDCVGVMCGRTRAEDRSEDDDASSAPKSSLQDTGGRGIVVAMVCSLLKWEIENVTSVK